MKKTISILIFVFALLFTGCADKNNSVAYDAKGYNKIKQASIGQIISLRNVYIKDNGTGSFIGATIGAVLGSTVGRGAGSTLASLGGGILGAVVGNEANKTNSQELTVTLDDGRTIVVLSKGTHLQVGDRVRIVTSGNEVSSVHKL